MPTTTIVGEHPAAEARRRSVGGGIYIADGPDDGDDDTVMAGRRRGRRGGPASSRPKSRRGGAAGGAVAVAAAAACCCAAASSTPPATAAVPSGTFDRAVVAAPRGGSCAFGVVPRLLVEKEKGPRVVASEVLLKVPRGGSVNDNAAGGDEGPASPSSASRRKGRRGSKGGEAEEKGRGRGRHQKEKEKQKEKQRRQRGPFRSRSRSRDAGNADGRGSSPPAPSPPQPPPPQLPDDYYELLGVSRTSTSDEIQRAYRRMAVRTHPDKTDHGDRTHFDAISEAYDVLSDETKRSIYDRYGKRGLEANAAGGTPGGGGSFFADDVFRTFFGGGAPGSPFGFSTGSSGFFQRGQPQRQQSRERQRTRSVRYQLEVTLEDLYRGSTRSVVIAKPTADDAPRRKRVDIDVERGMRHGSTVVLSGELDHVPNATPGDMIFVLTQTPHESFTRKNADLMCLIEISPREALTGVRGEISHLDDRVVELLTDPDGPPVHDGEVRVLKGEGMPVRGRPGRFGDLYVKFKVKWPVTGYAGLTTEERAILGDLMDVAAAAAAKSSSNSSASASGMAGVKERGVSSLSEDEDADVEGIRERLRERLAELLRRGGVGDEAAAAVAASAADASSSGAVPNATAESVNATASPMAEADAGEDASAGAGAGDGGKEEKSSGGHGGKRRGKGGRERQPRYLQPALASDFGTSHPDEEGHDRGDGNHRDHHHHHHYDDDDEEDHDHFGFSYGRGFGNGNGNNPFGQHFGFFSSSSGAGGPAGYGDRGGSRYYDDAGDAHRESNVQCQQM